MATFVLIHGGGHGGWCYQRVARLLQTAGHVVYAPSLTGLGERAASHSPDIDLDTHIDDVVQLLHYEDLHDVVLVGHSYGGMVITGVGDRTPERIGDLVFLDAANPRNGQSLVDVAGPMMNAARSFGRVENGIELVLFPDADPTSVAYYGITDPDDAVWVNERLTPHPWKCFEQPLRLTNEAALAKIPQSHIVCTSTLATRPKALMEQARAAGRLWDIDTGHDLMLTEPQAVTDALLVILALRD